MVGVVTVVQREMFVVMVVLGGSKCGLWWSS